MSSNPEKMPSIEDNVKIALANSGGWLTPSDNGAIATLLRLAKLIDTLFDMRESKDLPPLLARLTSLMEQLQLTPKSRADQDLTPKESLKDGTDFTAAYLRLIKSESKDDSGKGKKPRTASGGTGRANRSSTTTVAKERP